MTGPIIRGAEPFSAKGGEDGVLVLHGFTGSPDSMRSLAKRFAIAGYTVELPLLAGHGTCVEDMLPTRWPDWSKAADDAYLELSSRCQRVAVAGLSMGGTLTIWLSTHHSEIAGIILVNPAVEAPAEPMRQMARDMLASGVKTMPSIGSDIADPSRHELAYPQVPIEAALSLFAAVNEIAKNLHRVRCPVLLFTSTQDHVVPPISSDIFAKRASGTVERVRLERSFHVATMDFDRELIESRSVAWLKNIFST